MLESEKSEAFFRFVVSNVKEVITKKMNAYN